MKKQQGSVGDILTTTVCILAMSIVLFAFLDCVGLVQQKLEVGQLARKYILKMETEGCLTASERIRLDSELAQMGVTEVDLSGTTLNMAGYGEAVTLRIQGRLRGEYEFEEKRVSTAKH